jgi:hypothetical protein
MVKNDKSEKSKKNKMLKDLGFLVLFLLALVFIYKVFFNVKANRKTDKDFFDHYFKSNSKLKS